MELGARVLACACARVVLLMPRVGAIFSVSSLCLPYFSTLSHKRHHYYLYNNSYYTQNKDNKNIIIMYIISYFIHNKIYFYARWENIGKFLET